MHRLVCQAAVVGIAALLLLLPAVTAAAPPAAAPGVPGVAAADPSRPAGKDGQRRGGQRRPFPPPQRAWEVATLILGAPARDHITLSLYPAADLEGYIELGPEKTGRFTAYGAPQPLPAQTATQLTLRGLAANTAYAYRLRYRTPGATLFQTGPTYHFQTARPPGASFSFQVQGDSHPERYPKQNDPFLYEQTLLAVAQDRPDFFICLGDDFSVDALPAITAATVAGVYRQQLPYLGLVAHSAPLFLVNGNHEQAARCNLDGTADNVAVWAQSNRNALFPQPAPDDFYSGDAATVAPIGLLRDYYAWTWGDALFVVLDPYWHSAAPVDNALGGGAKRRDLWEITLGEAQYQWLKQTLEQSRATFKFVFAHHVNGTGRGGIECAGAFEWGGAGRNGQWEFDRRRPGWPLPIHQLLARNRVTIFFQGHDHLFARQELDGVVYQTVPSPADPQYAADNLPAYRSGDRLPSSGRVRVAVSPGAVQVDYVRSCLPRDATAAHPDGEVAFSYTLVAGGVKPGRGGAPAARSAGGGGGAASP